MRGVEVFPNDEPVALKSQTVVQVGSVIFTFVLPSNKATAHKQDIYVKKKKKKKNMTFFHLEVHQLYFLFFFASNFVDIIWSME